MKKFLKGFTLVEILIVIVIIGILIGALVPRMSAAQGRARDVARKNDLSNLQAAIVVAYQDLGRYPCTNAGGCLNGDEVEAGGVEAKNGVNINQLKSKLEAAGMNTVPKDPLGTNSVKGLGAADSVVAPGEYRYLTVESHGIPDGGFVLMAKTEVAGSSNWVVCEGAEGQAVACSDEEGSTCPCNGDETTTCTQGGQAAAGQITSTNDVKELRLCDSITKGEACSNALVNEGQTDERRTCVYKDERDLRYIVMY